MANSDAQARLSDLENLGHEVVDSLARLIDAVLKSETPVFNVTFNGLPTHEETIAALTKAAGQPPTKSGGSDKPTHLSREQLLREVYRYMSMREGKTYGEWSKETEDNNAGLNEHAAWVPAYTVERFLEHIRDTFDAEPPI